MTISVAIADDQALVRMGLRVLIESEDDLALAGEAEDGRQAVELVRRSQPDVILMDLQLPGINGTQALRLIRNDASGAGVPVVALTAFAMAEDRDRALLDGFDGYLSKPISVRDLPNQVARFLPEKHDDD